MNRISYIIAAVLAVILIAISVVVVFTDNAQGEKSQDTTSTPDETTPDNPSGESNPDDTSNDISNGGESSGEETDPESSEETTDPSNPEDSQPDDVIETWEYPGNQVRHIFTHCLIAWPELASKNAFIDCVTVSEWKKILQSLYENDYVLIDINYMYETYTETDGTEKIRLKNKITVPKGKKPLVISVDDVVYDPKKTNQGMIDKLVIRNGEIWGYTLFKDGREDYSQDNEIFPILEKFIKEHPDFSYKNGRVTLCLTGFAGILGYRTAPHYAQQGINVESERQKAMEVVNWLKSRGYSFASHSYSHGSLTSFSPERMEEDCRAWNDEVASLVGETKIYVYPYGGWVAYDTKQHQTLMKYGFRFFCGTSVYFYLADGFPNKGKNTGTVFTDRFTVAGQTFDWAKDPGSNYKKYKLICEYFEPYEIYDNDHRPEKLVRPDDLPS